MGFEIGVYGEIKKVGERLSRKGFGWMECQCTYSITGYVNVAATAEGNVQVALFNNGTQISNTAVTVTAAGAGDNVVLPIKYTIYVPASCCPIQIANRPGITIQLIEGPGMTVAGIVDVEN